jgi:hypothetical protein
MKKMKIYSLGAALAPLISTVDGGIQQVFACGFDDSDALRDASTEVFLKDLSCQKGLTGDYGDLVVQTSAKLVIDETARTGELQLCLGSSATALTKRCRMGVRGATTFTPSKLDMWGGTINVEGAILTNTLPRQKPHILFDRCRLGA